MAEKLRLDLPIVLPEVTDAADRCVERLLSEVRHRTGVRNAHVIRAAEDAPAQLCVHYEPAILSLAQLRSLVVAAGAVISARYGHATWTVDIRHERRARTIAETIRALPGVIEVEASAAGFVRAEFDRAQVSREALDRALVRMLPGSAHHPERRNGPIGHDGHQHADGEHGRHDEGGHDHAGHSHGSGSGSKRELLFVAACGVLLAGGYLIERLLAVPEWVPLVLYVGSYFFGGFFTLREAIDNLRLRRFEIDTLMLVAAIGAAALGAWAEGALLLLLFSLGHALEHYAMGRAKRAIEALAELTPRTAQVRRGDELQEVPVEALAVGDVIVVKPDARLPADGFVILGESSVNQAPVTGESIPVDKLAVADRAAARAQPSQLAAEHRVFAGTINGSGSLEVEVTRKSSETALAKVVRMVSEAEAQKSPTQRFTEKFERIFVPAVLGLTVLLLFAWVVVDEPFRDSFYRAMAVLVAASPCALAIATPSAVLSGVARAARGGVLVKGGGPLENLGSLSAIAFDKTGTLTIGKPRITDVIPAPGVDEKRLLAVAVAVEALSDHPLARAIVQDGREHLGAVTLPEASGLQSLTGKGVSANVDGEPVIIGKAELFGADGVAPLSVPMKNAVAALRADGRTTMVVRQGDHDLGAIGLMDTRRPGAKEALARLRAIGIRRMIMISGDHQSVADAVGRQVGIDEVMGDLMPEDKVDAIKKLRAKEKVAMVGDGVNDAPAMATATVGVVMGAAGSDVAMETADIALMADDLAKLPFAVGLSRVTRSIILQNVFVSLTVVALLVPATILGLSIGAAVAFHEGSTLIVVFNALRLLAYRDKTAEETTGSPSHARSPGTGTRLDGYLP
jgi:Cd2+/Zn2+-exporting ATPase